MKLLGLFLVLAATFGGLIMTAGFEKAMHLLTANILPAAPGVGLDCPWWLNPQQKSPPVVAIAQACEAPADIRLMDCRAAPPRRSRVTVTGTGSVVGSGAIGALEPPS